VISNLQQTGSLAPSRVVASHDSNITYHIYYFLLIYIYIYIYIKVYVYSKKIESLKQILRN